jgi:hypothetical protein
MVDNLPWPTHPRPFRRLNITAMIIWTGFAGGKFVS